MTDLTRDQAITREFERRFWAAWYAKSEGLLQAMRLKQYGHQQRYLPLIAEWHIGFCAPDESVIEVGCGPCGLAPWLGRGTAVGIEPLAAYHESQGVNYTALGYLRVWPCSAQDLALQEGLATGFDLAVCCNVIDHDADPVGLLAILTKLSNRIFLAYDLRCTATEMHPGVTMHLPTPDGWRVAREKLLPPVSDFGEIHGTRVVLLRKIGEVGA
jgi:hypothetical protein